MSPNQWVNRAIKYYKEVLMQNSSFNDSVDLHVSKQYIIHIQYEHTIWVLDYFQFLNKYTGVLYNFYLVDVFGTDLFCYVDSVKKS